MRIIKPRPVGVKILIDRQKGVVFRGYKNKLPSLPMKLATVFSSLFGLQRNSMINRTLYLAVFPLVISKIDRLKLTIANQQGKFSSASLWRLKSSPLCKMN